MELRRALLLFAIVLGLAAIATSVSRPRESRNPPPKPPPSTAVASPRSRAAEPLELRFDQALARRTRQLEAGRPATVFVDVDEPGEVAIEGLGLSAPAEPFTPARFDVLVSDEGRYPVRFAPAAAGEGEIVGTLDVGPPRGGR